jgi:hypothetical protein
MRLHRVQLRNYRGVVKSNVNFSQSGVTIVEGPNEVGKTAISEGLQLAIDLPDSSRSAQVRAVQPVGRDEGPEVEISLSSGKYELVYRKRWLRQPETTLEIRTPHHENLTGREAHDRLKAILAETLDEELWRALRIQQGTELILPNFGMPSMGRALDRAAGGDLATDREETLWTRIGEEYDKYWTPTGQLRVERRSSGQKIQETRDRVAELTSQLQEIESDAAQMSWLIDESTRLSEAVKEFQKSERELDQRWNAIDRLRSEVERLDAIHSASEAQRDGAASKWQRRETLIATLDASTRELAELEAEATAAVPGLEAATRRREEAAAAHKDADAAVREVRARLSRAIDDRDHLRQLIEVEQLKERHDRYLVAEETLKRAEAYLESSRVDDEVAKQIEEAYIEDERARSAAGSAAASMEVTALRDMALEVGDEIVALSVNEINRTLVEDEVVLTIPDVAQIRVSAGPESRGMAEQRRKTQETYRLLCEGVGVADATEARRAAQERQDAQRNKEESLKAIERELRDLTPDVLLGKVNNLAERVTSYPKERPENPPLPTDLDEAQRIEAGVSDLVKDCTAALRACEDAAQNAEAELNGARIDEAGRTAKLEMARSSKRDAANQLALDREGQADGALIAAVAAAQEKEARDRESFDEAKVRLSDADPDSVEALLDNARQATKRASDELQSNRDRQNGLRSSLDLRGEQGLQTAFDEAANQLNHFIREYERQEARAEAARLLRETFAKHRQQAHQHYIEPFKDCIDQLGRIVFGPTFAVELDGDLQVVRRTLDGTMLDVDQLSTGAREQLGVLSRLACATIVSPMDGGAPVMIDDALGWSDPQRLQGMGAAIAAAGKQCQVVVLTCTPGRYSHVGNAQVVSL